MGAGTGADLAPIIAEIAKKKYIDSRSYYRSLKEGLKVC